MSQQATAQGPADFSVDADWDAMFVDGEWRRAADRDRTDVTNPATGEVITQVPEALEPDVDEAYEAAVEAQREWANTSPAERAKVVREAARLLDEHAEDVREWIAVETGGTKPKQDIEHGGAVTFVYDAAQFAFRSSGKHNRSKIPGKDNVIKKEPAGVVGVITPWNVPLKLSIRVVAPAIALGNAVVLNPASPTPVTGGLIIANLFEEAGLPEGVLNVVPGSGSVAGDRVSSHPASDVVAFTGSTDVGRMVAKNAIDHFALPALELGGNNPHVVLEDADLDGAVDAGIFGTFWHQGQVCISINRHLVHESIYDEYAERLAERAASLPIGDPRDDENVIGPIINESQRDQIIEYIERTVEEGATLETGGDHDGLFVEPTVLTDVTNDMTAACNEHFGPVAPIIPFSSDDEAVEIANDTEYGLSGSVHSGDAFRAEAVADRIDTGMIHINDQPVNAEPAAPFGGMKSSGVGRYNSDWIIDELTEPKWMSFQREPRSYHF